MVTGIATEAEHEDVYGASFALYDKKALLEFLEPLRVRFEENKLSAEKLFSGKRCLDAGCGNGRGSLYMLQSGAAHVTSVDISPTNIQSTKSNLSGFGFSNFETRLTSLENLPFEAGDFDFVWCNGVLMHTSNPDQCLAELSRVLAVGGQSWIYVYGVGGVYWHFIRRFRRMLKTISASDLIDILRLMNYSTRFVGEYVDDWKTPFLRTYPDAVFRESLKRVGIGEARRLMGGMSYDTCHRIEKFPGDRKWLGEGDLRYLATKTTSSTEVGKELSKFSVDNPPSADDSFVMEAFDPLLQELEELASTMQPISAISACARIQHYLREQVLSRADPLDITPLAVEVKETILLLNKLRKR